MSPSAINTGTLFCQPPGKIIRAERETGALSRPFLSVGATLMISRAGVHRRLFAESGERGHLPGGEVASEDAHKHEEKQHGGHEAASVGRRQETQHGEHHGDEGHAEDLHTRAHVHGQQRRGVRWAEHVAVYLRYHRIPNAEGSIPSLLRATFETRCLRAARTSFQPVSSCASSADSSSLYCEMSRRSVRIMIIATMPVRNSTIMSELMMENQWIWSSVIKRYVSQRDAHLMLDAWAQPNPPPPSELLARQPQQMMRNSCKVANANAVSP
jgi:hypothetical protein